MKEFKKRMKDHEPETNAKLLELSLKLPRNAVVIDCGAHVGDTGIKLAKRLKAKGRQDIRIIEIEPAQDKIDFIKKQAKIAGVEKQLTYHCAGLWDKSTGGKIIRKGGNAGAWKVQETTGGDSEFNLRKLDDLVDRIDLVHLDVEGAEPKALMGMQTLIGKYHPPLIVEVIHSNDKTLPILKKMGYRQSGGQMLYDRLYLYKGKGGEKMEGMESIQPTVYIPLIIVGAILICIVIALLTARKMNKSKNKSKKNV